MSQITTDGITDQKVIVHHPEDGEKEFDPDDEEVLKIRRTNRGIEVELIEDQCLTCKTVRETKRRVFEDMEYEFISKQEK